MELDLLLSTIRTYLLQLEHQFQNYSERLQNISTKTEEFKDGNETLLGEFTRLKPRLCRAKLYIPLRPILNDLRRNEYQLGIERRGVMRMTKKIQQCKNDFETLFEKFTDLQQQINPLIKASEDIRNVHLKCNELEAGQSRFTRWHQNEMDKIREQEHMVQSVISANSEASPENAELQQAHKEENELWRTKHGLMLLRNNKFILNNYKEIRQFGRKLQQRTNEEI